MSNKIKIGIIGGAGYTAGELVRILINHPSAEIIFLHSKSNAGNLLSKLHDDLLGETDIRFTSSFPSLGPAHAGTDGDGGKDADKNVDIIFLCVGQGEAKKFLNENTIDEKIKIIDLSQDFRLNDTATIGTRNFVYGLPELNKEKIKAANNIANPGCFATAIQLGLLPLAKAGLISDVYTTGITGSTGAGQSLSPTSHFSWRQNNIQAYKTLSHQHLNEIYESIHQLDEKFPNTPSGSAPAASDGDEGNPLDKPLQEKEESPNNSPLGDGGKKPSNNPSLGPAPAATDGGKGGSLNFIPWRGDFTRGIFISSQMHCDLEIGELTVLYNEFYKNSPFVFISKEPIHLKQVVNTNKCFIQLEKFGSRLVVHSVIDNLLKGASGQAVQNMNLMFGLEETMGLKLKANYF